MCYGLGDYKSPGLIGRTFFTTDFKSVGTARAEAPREMCHFTTNTP